MLVVFDYDGVVVDTVRAKLDAFRDAVKEILPQYDAEEARRYYDKNKGRPDEEVALGLFGEKAGEVLEEYFVRCKEIDLKNKPFSGFKKLAEKLKADGHAIAISTSSPDGTVWQRVENAGLSGTFERKLVVGFKSGEHGFGKGRAHVERLLRESGEKNAVVFDDGLEVVKELRKQGINAFYFGKDGDVKNYEEVAEKVREVAHGTSRR